MRMVSGRVDQTLPLLGDAFGGGPDCFDQRPLQSHVQRALRPAVGGEGRARLCRKDHRPPLEFRVHCRLAHAADPLSGRRQGAALLADDSSRIRLARRQTRRGYTGFLLRGPQGVRGLRSGALAEGRARKKPRSRGAGDDQTRIQTRTRPRFLLQNSGTQRGSAARAESGETRIASRVKKPKERKAPFTVSALLFYTFNL